MSGIRVVNVLALLTAVVVSACDASSVQGPQTPFVPIYEVRLSVDDEVQLEWNATTQLFAVPMDSLGNVLPARPVRWLSSNAAVATVSQSGVVQAVGAGFGVITAVIDSVPSSVAVRVKMAPVTDVLLDLAPEATGLEVGETVFVGTRLKLATGQIVDSGLSWTSSDPAVATATNTAASAAAVVARSAGVVTLTGSAQGKSATLQLRITPKPTHDLIFNRWDRQLASEIFVLSLADAGMAPVRVNAGTVSRDPSPSPDGTQLVFAVSQVDVQGQEQNDLYVVNRNGLNMRRLTSAPGLEHQPTWSPDGRKILFHSVDDETGAGSLWTVNVDGSGLTNLTTALPAGLTDPRDPAWSPDGSRIAFTAARNAQHRVWTMNADGSNATQLTTDEGFDLSPTWSPDGQRIAFARYDNAVNGWDVNIVSAAGGAVTHLALAGDQIVPAWSPDGQYIAVAGTVVAGIGTQNIYTLRPDGTGLRLRTVNTTWGGGTAPAWVRR